MEKLTEKCNVYNYCERFGIIDEKTIGLKWLVG